MGMYTQLILKVRLKPNRWLYNVLNLMMENDTNDESYKDIEIKRFVKYGRLGDHSLFRTNRWKWMLYGNSAYFEEWAEPEVIYNKESDEIEFSCCFNIKNYENEIQLFLDFLAPFILDRGQIGTYRYEEWEEPVAVIKDDEDGVKIGSWRSREFE